MHGEKNRRCMIGIGCLAAMIVLALRTVGAVDMGGFDVEIGVGEQREFLEEFEPNVPVEETPVEDPLMEETPAEDVSMEEIPWEKEPPQDTSVEAQIVEELREPEVLTESETVVIPEPTAVSEADVTPASAVIPEADVTPASAVIPEAPEVLPPTVSAAPAALPAKTPIPTLTVPPVSTVTPVPTVLPEPAVTPVPKSSSAVLHRIFEENGAVPSVKVQCTGAVQIFSFRVNDKECAWKWEGDILRAAVAAKKGENKLELLLVSPSGEKIILSHGR